MTNLQHTAILLICLTILTTTHAQNLPYGFPDTERTKIILKQGWKFHLGDPEAKNFHKDLDDSEWRTVNVPHTLKLTSLTLDMLDDEKTQLVFHRKAGWYRKNIEISKSNKKVFLEFEGAHQATDLWVNGQHAGRHTVGGYSPFHFDITDFVVRGEKNQITLLVDNRRNELIPPDPGPMDYVKFSGLYRDLYLIETDPLHVTFNWESLTSGVTITTPSIDPVNKNATINIKTSVKNERTETVHCKLITRVIDREGIVVRKLINEADIQRSMEYQFNQIGSLEDHVRFWGIDDPYLYRINSVVIVDDEEIDFVENRIGLRKFEQDPVKGFLLNNEPIELVGFNRHQQYPYIGDAVPNSLHFKDMLQFKEYGYNVVRTAHYPHDDALIEACDELGILVYEEAPTWTSISQNEGWWENLDHAARKMVRNHRNHPSIVIWGAGVNHRGYVPRIHNAIKQEDPTRLTASQSSRWTGWQASGLTDINANMLYGPFIWDRSEPILAMEGGRGPKSLAPYKRDPLMTGLIAWTAHAYYTFHPTHNKAKSDRDRTRSGMMTIFRYPRPDCEWYKAELRKEPFLYVKEDWKEGTEEITVFSNGQEVELLINGKSIGRKKPSQDSVYLGLDHAPFHFRKIRYESGELVARAYFKSGGVLKATKQTPGEPYAIKLAIDTVGRTFQANGSDIVMAYATIVDKKGMTVSGASNLVTFSVKGDGSVVGDGADIQSNPMFPEYGVAPALIRAGNTVGDITIYARSKGLKPAKAIATLTAWTNNYITGKAQPIYDFTTERVDMGAEDQLLQFGWNPWNGKDETSNTYSFKSFSGATVTVTPGSSEGLIRWLGEMNVIGKYGFAYGDGVIVLDDKGMNLVFENLPKGLYQLTSWHHAPRSNSDSMDPNKEKLKSLTIHKVPYENSIIVSSQALVGKESIEVKVTEGKEMQWQLPGRNVVTFSSDGTHPVKINFNGRGDKGVWLNAFELSENK